MLSKIIIASLILIVCIGRPGMAQDECELMLVQAQEEFNAGHFSSIPAMLKDCLDKNQRRDWRQRANLLLAETYLLLEDPIGAEQSYLNVLRANPEYLTDQNRDPIDLVYLSGKFTATPIFSLHGYVGPNIAPVRVIHDVRIGGEAYTNEKYYVRLGWQAGAGVDFNYNDYLSAALDLNFSHTTYRHRTYDLFGINKDIVEFMGHQTWVTLPVSVKYSQSQGKIRRYGYVGFSFNYLMTANADVDIDNRDTKVGDVDTDEYLSFTKSLTKIGVSENRAKLDGSLFVGGGLKYKYKLDYFYLDLRYSFGMRNLVDPNNRFNTTNEGLPYPYVDDDFRMDNLAISVGYIHPLYKPRKLKKARTKSVLRKIEKEDDAKE